MLNKYKKKKSESAALVVTNPMAVCKLQTSEPAMSWSVEGIEQAATDPSQFYPEIHSQALWLAQMAIKKFTFVKLGGANWATHTSIAADSAGII